MSAVDIEFQSYHGTVAGQGYGPVVFLVCFRGPIM